MQFVEEVGTISPEQWDRIAGISRQVEEKHMLRLKMQVNSVKHVVGGNGEVAQEELELSAVYGAEGSANAQWSKYTPCGRLTMTVSNPAAFGKVRPAMFVFVDITETTKDAA